MRRPPSTASRRSICWSSISIRSKRPSPNGAGYDECVENIDIGGPAMIRAAAKNHAGVTVVVEPADYDARARRSMRANGGATTLELRKRLAAKAYARTAAYDAAISQLVRRGARRGAPDWRAFGGRLKQPLRYGENPHQRAAFYVSGDARPGVATRACSTRARSCPTTTSTTPTPRSSLSPSSAASGPPSPSSSTPTRAASRPAPTLDGGLSQGAALRSGQRLRRHHRPQRHDRRGRGRGDHQDLHRGRHRPGRDRRSEGHLRRQEEPAPADHRRPARSACGRRRGALARRRIAGAVARQRRDRRRRT